MAKKHGVTDIKHADAHQDEEMHVTRTTPQGTQEAGVDKGHELRDIKIRELLYWFAGLTVYSALTIAGMWFLVMLLTSQDRIEKTRLSTPLYGTDLPRRTPELLPNPDQLATADGYTLPWDHYRAYVKDQTAEMKKVGLEDEFGRPSLPDSVVKSVVKEPSSGNVPSDETRFSEASGGTGKEIAILTK